MVERVPPEAEVKYNKYLQLRDTYNTIVQQRLAAESSLSEVEKVLERLNGLSDDAEVYRMTGFILVRSTKAELVKELQDRKEELELKIKALKNQEDLVKGELERLASELQAIVQKGAGQVQPKAGGA
ncbi:MAG: prefoldin subunit beta [Acidilobus sp.]|nr:MAG: prefoldin, beta subunit, archaeal [uncultured Acidilobus sp. MG]ESQ24887.1 MAG: prefoldin, beta subunit, archaeal [uncultured Acidilobus sp. JCHS]MCG2872569.1 prefoldin subunit beta [Acidilobus sp.]MDT7867115.1 prefoldin subunit beta [Acidianus sp.]MCG2874359.1 prefoldin subunit beta [Acidilobus sp.]